MEMIEFMYSEEGFLEAWKDGKKTGRIITMGDQILSECDLRALKEISSFWDFLDYVKTQKMCTTPGCTTCYCAPFRALCKSKIGYETMCTLVSSVTQEELHEHAPQEWYEPIRIIYDVVFPEIPVDNPLMMEYLRIRQTLLDAIEKRRKASLEAVEREKEEARIRRQKRYSDHLLVSNRKWLTYWAKQGGWNESIESACTEGTEQAMRIRYYEELLDKIAICLELFQKDAKRLLRLKPAVDELSAYYGSDEWKKDFEDDEKGMLPKGLKRGVLSEDGVYNLLERYNELLSNN